MMRRICVAALLCGPVLGAQQGGDPAAEPAEPKAPTRQEARAAAKAIATALDAGERAPILVAFRDHGLLTDRDVARAVGKALGSDDDVVRFAAVRTLRYNPVAIAASELIAALRDEAVRASPELTAEVLRGLGQHREARAMPLIVEGLGPDPEPAAVRQARIDALGRIQTRDAINELIKFARSGFQKGFEEQIDLALRGQTGENHGPELRPWVVWWNVGKKTWRLEDEMPEPPPAWARLWAVPEPARMFEGIPGAGESGPSTGERGRGGAERGTGGDGEAGGPGRGAPDRAGARRAEALTR